MHRGPTGYRCGCGCGESVGPTPPAGMGGFFELILNAAGSTVGDPQLGSQIASTAGAPFARIKETPEQIAARVAPDVGATLQAGGPTGARDITQQSQQIAAAILPQLAAQLAAQGVMLPAGTVGAELQGPSYFNAFGGQNAQWVLLGGAALAGLLALREMG